MSSRTLALLYAFGSYQLWVGYDTMNKLAGNDPGSVALGPWQIALTVTIVMAVGMALLTSATGGISKLKAKRPRTVALYALCVAAETPCAIYGAIELPLPLFYCLYFTTPIVAILLCRVLLGERFSWPTMAACLIGFAGCLIALFGRADIAALDASWAGVAATLGGMVLLALSMTVVRWKGHEEHSEALVFWFALLTIVLALMALIITDTELVFDPKANLYALLGGVFTLFGYLFNIRAFQLGKASVVAPMHYTQMAGGIVLGWLIWRHVPDIPMLAGAGLIIAAGLWILWHQPEVKESA